MASSGLGEGRWKVTPPSQHRGLGLDHMKTVVEWGFVREASAEPAPSSGAVAFAELVVPGLPWGDAD